MTSTGKIIAILVLLSVAIAAGLTYYSYSKSTSTPGVDEYQSTLENQDQAGVVEGENTSVSKEEIQKETLDQSLAGFEADLESESSADLYDENSYVEKSNTSGELNLQY